MRSSTNDHIHSNDVNMNDSRNKTTKGIRMHRVYIAFHAITWLAVFILMTMISHIDKDFLNVEHLIRMVCPPIVMCAIFYVNYLYIVPHYLIRTHQRQALIASFLSIIVGIGFLNGYMRTVDELFPKETHKEWLDKHPEVCRECIRIFIEHEKRPNNKQTFQHASDEEVNKNWNELGKQIAQNSRKHVPSTGDIIIFILRDFILYTLVVAFAILMRMAESWYDETKARQTAEIKQKEAELQNMRNQISPHFLLNTLNNIYALTAFDTDKAQKAILDLGGLLRHMLYDSQRIEVDIQKEIHFLNNYINLMKLRQSDNVKIKTHTNIAPSEHFLIAPYIFISLIENAFKHGVSADCESFINISLTYDDKDNTITLTIENSNFPKSREDKSGSGIGLEQVQKRLGLMYPNQYTWQHNISEDGKSYLSHLIIHIANEEKEKATFSPIHETN